jgi:hypothetical protein
VRVQGGPSLSAGYPQCAVEPDRLAVEHPVLDDLAGQPRVLRRLAAALGKGTPPPSFSRASLGSAASSGVSNKPGAIVLTRILY